MHKNHSTFLILIIVLLSSFFSCDDNSINRNNLHKIEFITNGGAPVQNFYSNYLTELPSTYKDDYTFGGWYLTSSLEGDAVVLPLEVTSDLALYAKWIPNYTVTFVTNGGTSVDSYKTACVEIIPDTAKSNCEFCGWYTSSDYTGEPVTFPFEVTKPTTLYAKWISMYQISFETNDGNLIDSYTTAVIPESPVCYREGYSLVGWYLKSDFSKQVVFPYKLLANTTFYAKWTENFTVTFDSVGGTPLSPLETGFIEKTPVSTKEDRTLEG